MGYLAQHYAFYPTKVMFFIANNKSFLPLFSVGLPALQDVVAFFFRKRIGIEDGVVNI